jgi:hypothetical protein
MPTLMQGAEQMQQDDDEDRHAGQPQDDVAEHKEPPRLIDGIAAVPSSPNLTLLGADAWA